MNDERKLFLVTTQKEWEFKMLVEAFREVGIEPETRIVLKRNTSRINYEVYSKLTDKETALLKAMLARFDRPWSYKESIQKISAV